MKIPVMKRSLCGCDLGTGSLWIAYIFIISCIVLDVFLSYKCFIYWKEPMIIEFFTYAIVFYIELGVSILFLTGIYKKNLPYIMTWISYTTILIAMEMTNIVKEVPFLIVYSYFPIEEGLLLTAHIGFIVFSTYAVFVVYNYKRELLREAKSDTEAQPNNATV